MRTDQENASRWRWRVKELRAMGEGLLYLGPSLVVFVLFVFYPLVKSIRLSLYETDPLGVPKIYLGLRQYLDIFRTGDFGHNLLTTALFALYTVVPGLTLGLFLAYIANWRLRGMGIFRTVFASPLVVAVASASMIWMMLFNPSSGALNYFFDRLHLPAVQWLVNPQWALFSVALVAVWRSLGFNTLILLSGLQSIPEEIYESGRIDGAGSFRLFWSITLPMLSPSLFFLLIVSIINALQAFGEINILTQGGPMGSTNVIVYSIYREAFFNFHFGFASAEAIFLFLLILGLTLLQFRFLEGRVFYQ
ncbi:MAG: sugar ABC transporter permease [Firmicutes bacterium]|nr:sugar ABC transporter permease [Bacillota bacterium]